ncbi:MAG TPA: response regulator, partial [Candidatus Baltobacteraceae bacterium]|nr:response regulator [Candidatus Baltobacteraceae bacterium]
VVGHVRTQKPDLILLDIMFPPDVAGALWDGLRILEWLGRMGEAGNIPVIIISGAGVEKYKERCLAAGARAFFSKPLPMKELFDAIRKVLDGPVEKKPATAPSGTPAMMDKSSGADI